MAMSGVELEAECKVVYDEVQSKKKHRYVTFKIDDGKIKVDKVYSFDSSFSTHFLKYIIHFFRLVHAIATTTNFWRTFASRMAMLTTAVTPSTTTSILWIHKAPKHPTGTPRL